MRQLQSLPQVVFCPTSMKTSENCIPVMPPCFEIIRKKKSFPPSLLSRWLLRKSFCFYHMQNHIVPGFVVCKFVTTKCVPLVTHPNAFSLTNLSSELSSLPNRPWDTHRLVCKSIQAGSVSHISMEFTNCPIKERAGLKIPMDTKWQHQHHWVSASPAQNSSSGWAVLCLPCVDTANLTGKH